MSTKPLCICGKELKQMAVRDTYRTKWSFYKGTICCDECGESVNNSTDKIWHCPIKKKSEYHTEGYDLCLDCGTKQNPQIFATAHDFLCITNELSSFTANDCYTWRRTPPNKAHTNQPYNFFYEMYDSFTGYLTAKEADIIKFNNGAKLYDNIQNEIQQQKNYNNNIYYGDADTISRFPYIVAEIANCDKCILTENAHLKLKNVLNDFQANNTDICTDFRNAKLFGHGTARIHDIIDPNKNLASVMFDCRNMEDMNYFQWLPTRVVVNDELTQISMSDIPNLDPFKYKKCYTEIANVLLKMIPMFEHINCEFDSRGLREIDLKFVIKAQSYEFMLNDVYEGGVHSDGLFEDISSIGLYYYDISDNIVGGGLQLSSVVGVNRASSDRIGAKNIVNKEVKVQEGSCVVFSNNSFHKVCKTVIAGGGGVDKDVVGHRKVLAFFLIDPRKEKLHFDTRVIGCNWKAYMIQLVHKWFGLGDGNGAWLVNIIEEYVVGNKQFVKDKKIQYIKSRKSYSYSYQKADEATLTSRGMPVHNTYRRRACNCD